MKMYRLMGILLLLENSPVLTAQSLADHFEVSVRTIYRDLDVLSQAGFSIITESGHGGGVSLMNSNRVQLKSMDENELLKLVQKVIVKEAHDTVSENIALKIRSQLPSASQEAFDRLKDATLVDATNWSGVNFQVEDKLAVIQKAILNIKKLKIQYDGNRGQHTDRVLHPLGVAKKDQQWYLVAYCELRCEYRIFKIAKIMTINILENTYPPHPGFDLETFWKDSVAQFQRRSFVAERSLQKSFYPVEVKGEYAAIRELRGFDIVTLSENSSTYNMINLKMAVSQILPLSDALEIVEPLELKHEIQKIAKGILARNAEVD